MEQISASEDQWEDIGYWSNGIMEEWSDGQRCLAPKSLPAPFDGLLTTSNGVMDAEGKPIRRAAYQLDGHQP